MPALLFGSISTVADTSELQREAFNQAFAQHGLDWTWEREEYQTMLTTAGGRDRVAEFAESRGESVDADAIHRTKSELFQRTVGDANVRPRAGVVDSIARAKQNGWKVGLVTTTERANITALLDAISTDVRAEDFDVIVDVSDVEERKPDRAAYVHALEALGERADASVAVEDNINGVDSAVAAGITCVAFPNANTAGHDFPGAQETVEQLDSTQLMALATGAKA